MEKIKLNVIKYYIIKIYFNDNLYKYWKKVIYYIHKKNHIQYIF